MQTVIVHYPVVIGSSLAGFDFGLALGFGVRIGVEIGLKFSLVTVRLMVTIKVRKAANRKRKL